MDNPWADNDNQTSSKSLDIEETPVISPSALDFSSNENLPFANDPLYNPFAPEITTEITELVTSHEFKATEIIESPFAEYSTPIAQDSITNSISIQFDTGKSNLGFINENPLQSQISSSQLEEVFDDPLRSTTTEEVIEQQIQEIPTPAPKSEVYVTEPLKVGDIFSGYVEYSVVTPTSRSMRRFSDFLWLFNQLCNIYVGVIIPPIPEKVQIGRFQDEFIENRRKDLQTFLQMVVGHPLLNKDESLHAFLNSSDFQNVRKNLTSKPILGHELTPMLTHYFPLIGDNNQELSQLREDFISMEQQLKQMEKTCSSLQQARKDYTKIIKEFGDSLCVLGATDLVNPQVSHKLQRIAEIQSMLIPLEEYMREREGEILLSTLVDYIRILGSIKIQFTIRQKHFMILQDSEINLARKQKNLEKYSQSSVRTDKIQQSQEEVKKCSMVFEEESKVFRKNTDTLISELKQFRDGKVGKFKITMKQFLDNIVDTQREVSKSNLDGECVEKILRLIQIN